MQCSKERDVFEPQLNESKDSLSTIEAELKQTRNDFRIVQTAHEMAIRDKAATISILEASQAVAADLQARHSALTVERVKTQTRLTSLESRKAEVERNHNQTLRLYQDVREERDQWQKRADLERTKTRLARSALDRRAATMPHPGAINFAPAAAAAAAPIMTTARVEASDSATNRAWILDNGSSSPTVIPLPPKPAPVRQQQQIQVA